MLTGKGNKKVNAFFCDVFLAVRKQKYMKYGSVLKKKGIYTYNTKRCINKLKIKIIKS